MCRGGKRENEEGTSTSNSLLGSLSVFDSERGSNKEIQLLTQMPSTVHLYHMLQTYGTHFPRGSSHTHSVLLKLMLCIIYSYFMYTLITCIINSMVSSTILGLIARVNGY